MGRSEFERGFLVADFRGGRGCICFRCRGCGRSLSFALLSRRLALELVDRWLLGRYLVDLSGSGGGPLHRTADRLIRHVGAGVDLGHARVELLTHPVRLGTRSRYNLSVRLRADQPGAVCLSQYPLCHLVQFDALARQSGWTGVLDLTLWRGWLSDG